MRGTYSHLPLYVVHTRACVDGSRTGEESTVSEKPLVIRVDGSGDAARPIRVMLDVGDEDEAPTYDLDRDQARFLVPQLQAGLARSFRPPMIGRISNSGG
ncbi:hypothetical protein [Streptomyces sp. SID3343]|uniref:hypothetical protein n=1 Tax=Streptomyces sp. SID3343 TaxID=2690260 RepID=UPI00136A969A|nr:hypothetical protein [Streptomyces sp. SID3343]MYW06018.1 hypothetical protein [Streptomyces sp. SID3343]